MSLLYECVVVGVEADGKKRECVRVKCKKKCPGLMATQCTEDLRRHFTSRLYSFLPSSSLPNLIPLCHHSAPSPSPSWNSLPSRHTLYPLPGKDTRNLTPSPQHGKRRPTQSSYRRG
jgi:hypothetical protein